MKNRILLLAGLFLFVSALVGCGDGKEAKTEEGKATAKVEKSEEIKAAAPAPEAKPPEQQPAVGAEQKAPEASAGEMTIVGSVDAAGKVTAEDGQSYLIADNDAGKELIKLAAKKVEVKGTVSEKEGAKIMTVTAYQEAK
ncbi:MAG: hypothetical protein KKE57_04015 [Proteobacteria bacterium]|nr:hypothetical protein [Pseudomonadota bacterium]